MIISRLGFHAHSRLRYSPVDTLGESRLESVGASALEDIDESTRVEYDLESPVPISRMIHRHPSCEAERFRFFPHTFVILARTGQAWAQLLMLA